MAFNTTVIPQHVSPHPAPIMRVSKPGGMSVVWGTFRSGIAKRIGGIGGGLFGSTIARPVAVNTHGTAIPVAPGFAGPNSVMRAKGRPLPATPISGRL